MEHINYAIIALQVIIGVGAPIRIALIFLGAAVFGSEDSKYKQRAKNTFIFWVVAMPITAIHHIVIGYF